MKIVIAQARFSGLYEWGVGWLSAEKKEAWEKYFRELGDKSAFWSHFETGEGSLASRYLVSTDGCVYLHPLDIDIVLHSDIESLVILPDGRTSETFPLLEDLKNILSEAANVCGGKAEFSDISVLEASIPRYK